MEVLSIQQHARDTLSRLRMRKRNKNWARDHMSWGNILEIVGWTAFGWAASRLDCFGLSGWPAVGLDLAAGLRLVYMVAAQGRGGWLHRVGDRGLGVGGNFRKGGCRGWAALGQGLLVGCTEAEAGRVVQRLGCTGTEAVGDCSGGCTGALLAVVLQGTAAAGWTGHRGVFLAVSSNTRYQIINGLERLVESSPLAKQVPPVAMAFTVGVRFANNIYGGMQFVDWARWSGVHCYLCTIMDKSEVSRPIIITLEGPNYIPWSQAMSSFLKGRKLWRYVTGDIKAPTQGAVEMSTEFIVRLEEWDSKKPSDYHMDP
ncbi:reticulata-like protein, putative [Actinidia rufa]|uniref:Reticulata-like protein, putative n=1 Tax=Actinidia rufa TaxID=165716 RepID=A0A7J0FU75_9ERIC|nr:reticulata-like protein, putative [Actinidia rufa]